MLTIMILYALAQQPDPAQIVQQLNQQAGEMARQWLHSPDARTEAWGAYLALRDRRVDLVPDLLALVEAYLPGAPVSLAAQDQHDAIMAVVDALIQLQAAVPAHDVAKIYSEFPVQALLLVPHANPRSEVTPFLMTLFESEQHNPGVWQSAGNMLAGPQASAFGIAVFKSMTVRATAIVVGPQGQTMHRGGVAGDCLFVPAPRQPKTGWPEISGYVFAIGMAVLAPGVDTVHFNRIVDATYAVVPDTCVHFSHPDLVREHYLATVLNQPIQNPPIKHEVSTVIKWSGEEDYKRQLASFIADQQEIFADVAAKLAPRPGIVVSERPRLIVEIWDQRSEKTPLPQIETSANVSFTRMPF